MAIEEHSVEVSKIRINEFQTVALLHKQHISQGFLSSLGIPFLKLFYASMYDSQNAFCIVARNEKKEVIGFTAGCLDLKEFYKDFLKKNLIKASFTLFPQILRPNVFKKILETLLYPVKKPKNFPSAELLSIVVSPAYQGKGVSAQLFQAVKNAFTKRGITKFKILVGSERRQACKFYEKMGCRFHCEIKVHKGEKSFVYVCNCL